MIRLAPKDLVLARLRSFSFSQIILFNEFHVAKALRYPTTRDLSFSFAKAGGAFDRDH